MFRSVRLRPANARWLRLLEGVRYLEIRARSTSASNSVGNKRDNEADNLKKLAKRMIVLLI